MPVAFGDGGSIPVSNVELGLLGANTNAFFTVMSDSELIGLVDSITAVICPGRQFLGISSNRCLIQVYAS